MALVNGGAVKSRQKLTGTIASQAYPQGSTIKTFPMPSFQVGDASNAELVGLWWRVVSGTLNQPLTLFADVTGPNEVTVLVNNPGASLTISIALGGVVVEYA